jgi:hypothetical protein
MRRSSGGAWRSVPSSQAVLLTGGHATSGRAPGGCRTGERATRRMGRLHGYTEEREYGDTEVPMHAACFARDLKRLMAMNNRVIMCKIHLGVISGALLQTGRGTQRPAHVNHAHLKKQPPHHPERKPSRSLSLSPPPPFNLPISHFGKAILFQPREGNRGEEGRGGGGSEHDERDHQRPHRAGRDPGRQLLLGALLPRARHPARWHHAQVTTLPISI